MSTYALSKLLDSIDNESISMEQNLAAGNVDLFLTSLDLNRISNNLDSARGSIIDLEAKSKDTKEARSHLKNLTSRINGLRFEVDELVEVEREKKLMEERQHRRQSSLAKPNAHTSSASYGGGRSELLGSTGIAESDPSKAPLDIEKATQDSLTDEILKHAAAIKQNALKFSEKVSADQQIVEMAGKALDKSSAGLGNVGDKLDKYRSSTAIGWWFYIFSALFILLSVVVAMIIVRLFPKW